jgi:hypothetical protein
VRDLKGNGEGVVNEGQKDSVRNKRKVEGLEVLRLGSFFLIQ